jgi:glycine C-acetyltransferase
MPLDRLTQVLETQVAELEERGTAKGAETVVTEGDRPAGRPRSALPSGGRGRPRVPADELELVPRHVAARPDVIRPRRTRGAALWRGPGAVRFISGTYDAHVELERRSPRSTAVTRR